MWARRVAALLLAALALGCGEKPEPDVSKQTAVTGTLDLARPRRARPTRARPPGTGRPTRRPARGARRWRSRAGCSRLEPRHARTPRRRPAAVQVGADGRFRARGAAAAAGREPLRAPGDRRPAPAALDGRRVDHAAVARARRRDRGEERARRLRPLRRRGLNAWIPLLAAGLLDRAGPAPWRSPTTPSPPRRG